MGVAIPGRDAASKETLNSAPIDVADNPGVPVEPSHPAELWLVQVVPLSSSLCHSTISFLVLLTLRWMSVSWYPDVCNS